MVFSLVRPRAAQWPPSAQTFCFGIEEEYFLAHADTLAPAKETPESIFGSSHEASLGREMLQAQLEVATRPTKTSRTPVTN